MVFKSKLDRTFLVMYTLLILFLIGLEIFVIFEDGAKAALGLGAVLFLVVLYLILSSITLKVIVEENSLLVKMIGIKFYKTPIANITKVKKGETMWSGLHKYGTSTGGLIVFSKYKDDLYITPLEEEKFLNLIKEINPNIVIETKI